ncbi:hypothetical protein [Pseudomonas soli]|uniref:hypothetical protein n=1 Tax=Pseudomonas soli TaxID=1306993 RepID=UPI0037F3ECD4
MKIGSLYYASDKAMFDALTQRKVTVAHLRELFLSRGIIISPDTDKEELAKQFSSFFHDYADFQKLSILIGAHSTRERTTNVDLKAKLDKEQLLTSLQSTKELLEDKYQDGVDFWVQGDAIMCSVRYTKTDYGQSEFRQVIQKEAQIKFEPTLSGWKVTGPMNDKFKLVSAALQSQIEIVTEEKVRVVDISLSAYPDSSLRSKFFRKLIHALPKMKVVDVIDVATFNPVKDVDDILEEDDDDLLEGDEPKVKESKAITRITKAQLRGQGVLESEQLLGLETDGFYIWKILWHAVDENQIDSDMYVLESQFGKQTDCSDFSYIVKGVMRYQSAGEYGSRVKANPVDEERIKKLIVKAAESTLSSLTKGK